MSIFKNPSQLETKATLSALIYGQPGIGKSTLACSAPNAVMLDFDGGVNRMDVAHQVPTLQVHNYGEVDAALNEIGASPEIETIIVDTVGKMLTFMEADLRPKSTSYVNRDGTFSLKGYGARKQMFIGFLNRVSVMGRNVIFVAHEKEERRGDDTIIRPEVGGSSANDLIKELDLVGYMEANGKQRTICFDPCEKFYGKNTCGLHGVIKVPYLFDADGVASIKNDFMKSVITGFQQRLAHNREEAAEYEGMLDNIRDNIAVIANAEDCNNFTKWINADTTKHIFNSKAVARELFADKVATLKVNYDKSSKVFSDAEL
jgi:hypothetical protein